MESDQRAKQVVQGLSQVKSAVADNRQSSARDLTAILSELKAARAEQVTRLEAILNEQTRLLDHQARQQAAERETIQSLRNRINQLEDQLRSLQPTAAPKKNGG